MPVQRTPPPILRPRTNRAQATSFSNIPQLKRNSLNENIKQTSDETPAKKIQ